MKLKITVGVICHNEEKQILDCLQSLNENQQDFHELIIVDNNSTDATLTLVKQALIEMQICTQVVARSKNNIAEARNDILQRANGELIYFIDSDCRLKKDSISQLLKFYTPDPQVAVWGGAQIFPHSVPILEILDQMRKKYFGHFGSHQLKISTQNEYVDHISTTHALYKKDILMKIGGFDPRLQYGAEDLELSLRLYFSGYRLLHVPTSKVIHYHVKTWQEWCKKAFRNGVWQTRLTKYNPQIFKTRRPWPALLFPFVVLVPIKIFGSLFLAYLFLIFILSAFSDLQIKKRPQLFALFILTHFFYGVGEIYGIFHSLVFSVPDAAQLKELPQAKSSNKA